MAADPSIPVLLVLLRDGSARVPATWKLEGPATVGLWWRVGDTSEVVATPVLVRLARDLPNEAETAGALLATESRFRQVWLSLEAARLSDLGFRDSLAALCEAIELVGAAAATLRDHIPTAQLEPTEFGSLELAVFGAPADQAMAALPLRRAMAATAALVEGGRGAPQAPLPAVPPEDLSVGWCAGRLLQSPRHEASAAGAFVLHGQVSGMGQERMHWVLQTPWLTLLAVLGFTAEAWAAERRGGVQLELPLAVVQTYGAPSRVDVVVTLPDGQEVVCGSLGELCIRTIDALGMAIVPPTTPAELDLSLTPVITHLLRAGVWTWKPDARPRYVISDDFSRSCYGGLGHRAIYLSGESLSETLRSVCVAWARSKAPALEVLA
jgi:hypothetical protein